MSSADGLTQEHLRKVLTDLQVECPRRFLLLVPIGRGPELTAMLESIDLFDLRVEVREHKFTQPGRAYLMRHPDDFLPIRGTEIMVEGPADETTSMTD
jgi:hypothetical protein